MNEKILKSSYDAEGALMLLLHTDPSLDLQEIEEVYYPYVRLLYLIEVGTGKRLKKLNKYCDCIIDRVSGSTYEGNGTPEFEEEDIPEDRMLAIGVSLSECHEIGHSFAFKQYIGKAKLMQTPRISVVEENAFYKKFFVVKCLDVEGQEYFILVDSVEGGISVLDHEKYHAEQIEEGTNF